MQRVIMALAAPSLLLPLAPAGAAPAPIVASRPESVVCVRSRSDYDRILHRLATSAAEGAVGSVKSLKLREAEDQNLIMLGKMAIDQMTAAGCATVPEGPPSALPYLLAALRCERERRAARGQSPPSCNVTDWRPFTDR